MTRDEASQNLDQKLRQEILFARERVYHFAKPTPFEQLDIPGLNFELWVKREEIGRAHV